MLRFLIVSLACFYSVISWGSQTKYYEYINKAEEKFVLTLNRECFNYYDSAFATDAQYFAKDAYIAAEIALFLKDNDLFLKYVKLSFDLGLPWTAIKSGKIIEGQLTPGLEAELKELFTTRKEPDFDHQVRDKVYDYAYRSDSIKLIMGRSVEQENLFFAIENEFRNYLYTSFLLKGVFPNENLIGIATDSVYQDFLKRFNKVDLYSNSSGNSFGQQEAPPQEYDLVAKYSYSVLLHSRCSFSKFQKELWNAVLNGYLLPSEYALLHETSILWNSNSRNPWDDCEPAYQEAYYNVLGFNPMKRIQTHVDESNKELMEQVELNRKNIYMQKWEIDKKKKEIQKKTGIRFFFGFLS